MQHPEQDEQVHQVLDEMLEIQQLLQDDHYIMYFTTTESYLLFFHYHQDEYLQQHINDLLRLEVDDLVVELLDILVEVVDDPEVMDEIFSYLQTYLYEAERLKQ